MNSKIIWQHSGSTPRLMFIDARATVLFLITFLHITEFTLFLSLFMVSILIYVEKYKRITPEAFFRLICMLFTNMMIGNKRLANNLRKKIYYTDKRIYDLDHISIDD